MKNLAKLAAFAAVALNLPALATANTVWNLNATFAYNSSTNLATGSFTLDPGLALVSWNILVSGTNGAADNTYTSADSIAIFPDLTHLDFYDGGTNQYIDLYLASPLSNSGGTINLLYGDGGQSSNATIVCAGCGTLVSGTISTAAATPEPSYAALISVAGLVGLAFLRRRKPATVEP